MPASGSPKLDATRLGMSGATIVAGATSLGFSTRGATNALGAGFGS
jgi:hypothetical protein